MDCFRQKRRRKKEEREQQKFRHLTPHTSPAHSQPSSLSHATHPNHTPPPSDHPPRLPKVGSYGLWVGAPGIYASTPSPAYAYGGGRSSGKQHPLMQPAVMHRASSDPRLLNSRGPGVYSAGGGQPRIYHSQGIPSPLSPVYEIRDPNDGSLYDVYQIGGGSTTRLLQDSNKSSGKRVQRSQSEVVSEPSRRAYRTKHSPAHLRASRASSSPSGSTDKEKTSTAKMQSADNIEKDTKKQGEEKDPMLIEHVEKIMKEEQVAVATSATDSMKLLAKNKTDDQKTVRQSSASENLLDETDHVPPEGAETPDSLDSPPGHYVIHGDIYAMPDKKGMVRPSAAPSDLASGNQESKATGDLVADLSATLAETLVIDEAQSHATPPIVRDPIYQEIGELDKKGETADAAGEEKATGNARKGSGDVRVSTADTVGMAQGPDPWAQSATDATSAGNLAGNGLTVEETRLQREAANAESEQEQEQNRAGKHISETAEAFEFLDTYLSDEENITPPMSPSPILADHGERT